MKTWAIRIALWGGQLAVLAAGVAFYVQVRVTHHVNVCNPRLPPVKIAPGAGLVAAKALVECLDREADWVERLVVLDRYRETVTAPEPVPCKYVGEWKTTRELSVPWSVTLNADRTFTARALGTRETPAMTGTWVVKAGRIGWLYDHGLQFPFDVNKVSDASATAFTVLERDGSPTRYEIVRRFEAAGCVP